jgi:hypothetical protein
MCNWAATMLQVDNRPPESRGDSWKDKEPLQQGVVGIAGKEPVYQGFALLTISQRT